ncbi:Atypical kinase COQ8B, mitochondrial [Hondaea fermentalgiana]|uniref:Atypical kinase COQ8B, mitochondrial n=1 Tax=Hondaea fermentalgiana TaxID=2315210 RepID=A0A2R5GUC3_9STRA|nr:Atypical kinase COQ8B, mitochondrial [Hondaea fermentalgiana]|eukprot:GBG32263.1 Atypical kinase COQ8B, mitochondrial [Hondaea fermentalgiana]
MSNTNQNEKYKERRNSRAQVALLEDTTQISGKQRAEALVVDGVRIARTVSTFCRIALLYKWSKVQARLAVMMESDKGEKDNDKETVSHREKAHARGAQLALELCRKNGGVFVKFGQHAASLKGALPRQYIEALGTLQDRAQARPLAEVMATLEEEIGAEALRDLVAHVDEEAVGCASLAQVHRAELRDGRIVALKVQHRDLLRVLRSDLHLVKYLDAAAAWLFANEGFSLAWAVREFEENLTRELDFLEEAQNCERSAGYFARDPRLRGKVRVPGVHWELTTPRLVCMDYIKGIPIAKVDELKRAGVEPSRVASIVLDAFAAMIFEYGFVHCDPHPGNLLVCPESDSSKELSIALLDHGLYRDLGSRFRRGNCQLWEAMILQDQAALRTACEDMGMPSLWDLMPFIFVNRTVDTRATLGDRARLTSAELQEIKDRLGIADLGLASVGSLADKLPDDMVLVLKTMHLVKDLNDMLGGSNRNRFLVYAKAAVRGDDAGMAPYTLRWSLFQARFYLNEARTRAWLDASGPSSQAEPVQQSLSAVMSESFDP